MKLLGIRFCAVAEEAVPMAQFFTKGLGLAERDLGGDADTFSGCVIPAADSSWIEIWQKGADMPIPPWARTPSLSISHASQGECVGDRYKEASNGFRKRTKGSLIRGPARLESVDRGEREGQVQPQSASEGPCNGSTSCCASQRSLCDSAQRERGAPMSRLWRQRPDREALLSTA